MALYALLKIAARRQGAVDGALHTTSGGGYLVILAMEAISGHHPASQRSSLLKKLSRIVAVNVSHGLTLGTPTATAKFGLTGKLITSPA